MSTAHRHQETLRTGNGQYAKSAKLAAFDMDGTLLQGRLVFELASRFDLEEKVRAIQASKLRGFEQSEAIALLFKGIPGTDVTSAIESIPLAKNCEKAVSELKERGYATGIISDSYTLAANYVAEKLGMDFVSANQLEVSGGKLTGNVTMPLGWEQIGCFCKISVCKRYHLEKAARERGVDMRDTVAIGDTRSDVCMIQAAGKGIAFMPKDEQVTQATSNIINDGDLYKVLLFLA